MCTVSSAPPDATNGPAPTMHFTGPYAVKCCITSYSRSDILTDTVKKIDFNEAVGGYLMSCE